MRATLFRLSPRLGWILKALGLLILAILCAVAFWLGTGTTSAGTPNGGLVIEAKDMAIGTVWEDPAFPWVLPLRNPTNHDIEIHALASSCGCMILQPSSLTVPSGATASVRLTLDLTSATTPTPGSLERDFSVQIIPILSASPDASHEPGWLVQGHVRSVFSLTPRQVHFGQSVVRGQPTASKKVALTPHTAFQNLTAECDANFGSARIKFAPGDGVEHEIEITPSDSLPAGSFHFTVTVRAVASDGQLLPNLTIPVDGFLMEDIQANPPGAWLGPRAIGEAAEETIVLQSQGGKPFEVTGIDVSSPDTTAEPLGKPGPAGRAFRVVQRIRQEGSIVAKVQFVVSTAQGMPKIISVPVWYHGVANRAGARVALHP